MNHAEIISRLSSNSAVNPSEVIFCITTQDILTAITRRMGEESLTLSAEDLKLAREEVKDAINHHLDIREYINIGLDSWEVIRLL